MKIVSRQSNERYNKTLIECCLGQNAFCKTLQQKGCIWSDNLRLQFILMSDKCSPQRQSITYIIWQSDRINVFLSTIWWLSSLYFEKKMVREFQTLPTLKLSAMVPAISPRRPKHLGPSVLPSLRCIEEVFEQEG